MNSKKTKTLLLASIAIFLAISLMLFPKESLEASVRGMNIWWNVVFPSLLPFFIVSELLISFGVVTLIGTLLEPLMRPLFRVPGVGGFVWAMGLASGNPAGAKLTARLRHENKLTQIEAERLVSFTSSSNPLFIFGAVAVGFFHNPALGILLACAHYGANLFVGLIMRFYMEKENRQAQKELELARQDDKSGPKWLTVLYEEHQKDGRSLGKVLGDAVQSSVQTLLIVGGFIILFSVINKVLTLVHFVDLVGYVIGLLLVMLHLPVELGQPIISGLFEMTLGAQRVSETTQSNLLQQVIAVSFLLGFSGFSIQAQVASLLAETDIRFKPFIIGRVLQGLFAAGLVIVLFQPLYIERTPIVFFETVMPAFNQIEKVQTAWGQFLQISPSITLTMLVTATFIWTYRQLEKSF
ncbi:sporulation integral membrane protein YlbJ [Alkalihalobacillus sp. 1P02AB]|uniref:sporulation integral membrane protein YlbJ n=1 Tax=Alkalihalobacillus sp. 1P02AB TaxID=3132260 RepID=UPI0039A61159